MTTNYKSLNLTTQHTQQSRKTLCLPHHWAHLHGNGEAGAPKHPLHHRAHLMGAQEEVSHLVRYKILKPPDHPSCGHKDIWWVRAKELPSTSYEPSTSGAVGKGIRGIRKPSLVSDVSDVID